MLSVGDFCKLFSMTSYLLQARSSRNINSTQQNQNSSSQHSSSSQNRGSVARGSAASKAKTREKDTSSVPDSTAQTTKGKHTCLTLGHLMLNLFGMYCVFVISGSENELNSKLTSLFSLILSFIRVCFFAGHVFRKYDLLFR